MFVSVTFLSFEGAPTSACQTHIVLLDDLLEPGIIQLRKLGKVVHVGYDVAQILFQQ